MMGHTPGPWYANQDCIEIDGPEGPRDVTLAVVMQAGNADADARLIASAPSMRALIADLVDAMDGACEFVMWDDGWQEIYLRCKRILEATNEQDRRVD